MALSAPRPLWQTGGLVLAFAAAAAATAASFSTGVTIPKIGTKEGGDTHECDCSELWACMQRKDGTDCSVLDAKLRLCLSQKKSEGGR